MKEKEHDLPSLQMSNQTPSEKEFPQGHTISKG